MTEKPLTEAEIINLLINKQLTLTAVIDAVIKVNGIIGVGLISLSDGITIYIQEYHLRRN